MSGLTCEDFPKAPVQARQYNAAELHCDIDGPDKRKRHCHHSGVYHMKLLFKLLMRIGLISSGPAVSSITSATQAEGTSLVHTVTLASAVAVIDGLYPFSLSGVTATSGTDYTATPTFSAGVTRSGNTLTVPVGVSSFTITVSTTDDAVFEGTETYSITVGGMTNTGTITDDESAPTIASVSSASATEGSNIVHTVAVTGTAQASRTFAFAFSGAAVGGTDYNATPTFSAGVTLSGGNITVPAGVTSFAVTVATINNGSIDGSRSYTLTIGGASGTGTVNDDDAVTPAFTVTMTALSNATGTVTTLAYINPVGGGGGGVITVDVQAARITGVAPLYVNFDATGTTSSATSDPSHECLFGWNFGDTGAGTWANGVQGTGSNSKNTDYGPVAGHVFETPSGTPYTVTLGVSDYAGNTSIKTVAVTVIDPDVFYSGTNTICVSQTTDTTGAPSGATLLTSQSASSIYSIFEANKGTNKRIMLHAGQNWTTNNTLSWAHSGMTLTKFGSGATPKIVVNAATCVSFAGGLDEIRLFDVDFEIDAAFSTSTNGIVTNGVLTKALWMRVNANRTGGGTAFLMNPGNGIDGHLSFDQCAIVECSTTNRVDFGISGMSAFVSVVRGSIMGNSFDNATFGEQVLRIPHLRYSTVNHNNLARSNLNKAVFRVHGFNYDSWPVKSEFNVLSNNILDNRGGRDDITNLGEFGAADGSVNREGVGRQLIENNMGYSKVDSTSGQVMFDVAAPDCTIRNNIFNCTVGTPSNNYKSCIFLGTNSGVVGNATTGTKVYNNSMFTNAFPRYSGSPAGGHEYVAMISIFDRADLGTTYGTLVARNNLIYSNNPQATLDANGAFIVYPASTVATIMQDHNTTDQRTNPNFTATPPVAYSDWKPTSGYAVNGGTPVPVVKDFLNATRSGTFDIGALQP